MKEPDSMEECIYFTNRNIGKGKIKAWVFKEKCPKCKKALMGKPRDEKTGKPKIRSKEYVCPECNYTVEKQEYEDTLTINTQYTCHYCGNVGELSIPFKRKRTKVTDAEGNKKTAEAVTFECQKCSKKLFITKKMA